MKEIMMKGLLCFALIINIGTVKASRDIVFIDRMLVSNSVGTVSLNPLLPGESVDVVRSRDEIIYYVANIGVINPTKKKYDIEIIIVDSKENIVLKGNVKRSLSDFMYNLDGDIIKGVTQNLGLNPKPGAMASGQLISLEDGNDYFIKLYVEKKLIGITKFHYIIDKISMESAA